jgi:hypothetical protein
MTNTHTHTYTHTHIYIYIYIYIYITSNDTYSPNNFISWIYLRNCELYVTGFKFKRKFLSGDQHWLRKPRQAYANIFHLNFTRVPIITSFRDRELLSTLVKNSKIVVFSQLSRLLHLPLESRGIMFHISRGIMFHISRGIMFHISCGIIFHISRGSMFHISHGSMCHISRGSMFHISLLTRRTKNKIHTTITRF